MPWVPLTSTGGHYGFMVKLRKALVVLPGDLPDEVALVSSSHGYAIYLGGIQAGSPTFVSADLGVPRAILARDGGGADLPSSQGTGKQPDSGKLRECCSGAGAAGRGRDLDGHPSARVAISESSGQLGVRVWKPTATPAEAAKARAVTKVEGKVDEAFRETFAQVLAETFLGAIWPTPAPSTEALQDYDTLSQAAEYVLEPETLLLKGINAAARAAAHAATFGLLAPLVGKLAENFCAPLLRPSAERQAAADMVKIIDIDLYAEDEQVAQCPALRDLTAEQAANVIGNSLKLRPGTPIERESLMSQPHGQGGSKGTRTPATEPERFPAPPPTTRRRWSPGGGRGASEGTRTPATEPERFPAPPPTTRRRWSLGLPRVWPGSPPLRGRSQPRRKPPGGRQGPPSPGGQR